MARKGRRKARSRGGSGLKAAAVVVVIALVVSLGVVFCPRLIHRCDNCDKLILGTGYYANVVSNAIGSLTGNAEKILCRDCAAREHAIAIAAGKSLSDFKRPLFEQ